jgi:hypothetical protein
MRFGTNSTNLWNKVFAWPPAKNWHHTENWLRQNWSQTRNWPREAGPNRAGAGNGETPPRLAPGQGVGVAY